MGERAKWQTAVKGRINERSGERRNVARSALSGKYFESGLESNRLDWTRKYFESIRVESESPSDSNRSSRVCSSSSRVQARLESKTSVRVRVQPRLDSNRLVRNPTCAYEETTSTSGC